MKNVKEPLVGCSLTRTSCLGWITLATLVYGSLAQVRILSYAYLTLSLSYIYTNYCAVGCGKTVLT